MQAGRRAAGLGEARQASMAVQLRGEAAGLAGDMALGPLAASAQVPSGRN